MTEVEKAWEAYDAACEAMLDAGYNWDLPALRDARIAFVAAVDRLVDLGE